MDHQFMGSTKRWVIVEAMVEDSFGSAGRADQNVGARSDPEEFDGVKRRPRAGDA